MTTPHAAPSTSPAVPIENGAPAAAVVSVDMGYGHLRAAQPLSDALEAALLRADVEPLADAEERRLWDWVRFGHEGLSRLSKLPGLLGSTMRAILDGVTMIPPLHEYPDLSAPTPPVKALDRLIDRGLGDGLVAYVRAHNLPLLTTFYAPAIVGDRAGLDRIYCVVTDADIHRIWAPYDPAHTSIHYFAPSKRVQRRLQAYGVPKQRITFTGFPLPTELLGGPDFPRVREDLARRIVRLDPERSFRDVHGFELEHMLQGLPEAEEGHAPHLAFAVGGAGAQAELAQEFLPSLASDVRQDRLHITLIAGVRPEVVRTFERIVTRAGLEAQLGDRIRILHEPDFETYYRSFNRLIRSADILWTKPSEMSFYAALGIPLILSKPLGSHERFNRRWLREQGVGLKQRHARYASGWLNEWLSDGTLAAAAWTGFMRLPKAGTYQIVEHIRRNEG